MDQTEAEDIKKRWQEYTEELYKRDLHNQENHDGVIPQLEPDILECEVKWVLGSISMNKVSGGDCSHEIKRCLLLGREVMTNLDSIFKSRDITLPTNVHLVKAMVFPLVMYGCESWAVKKAECQRTDAFELWCWRRLLRVPGTAQTSNQSILKEINSEYSLEGLTPKLQYLCSNTLAT